MKSGRVTVIAVIFAVLMGTAACGIADAADSVSETAASSVSLTESEATQTETETAVSITGVTETSETETEAAPTEEKKTQTLIMKIGNKAVDVTWEDNASVEELKELAKSGLTIKMSKYGGFEQVGSIGKSITSNDKQTKTAPGDIVLYTGNKLVVFYGSNSWAYTRLGKINMSKKELKDLLGKGNVTVTLTLE